jgi:hypothetical protein
MSKSQEVKDTSLEVSWQNMPSLAGKLIQTMATPWRQQTGKLKMAMCHKFYFSNFRSISKPMRGKCH